MTTLTFSRRPKSYPGLHTTIDRATYNAALLLVAEIDDHCKQGTRHYRNAAGGLLVTLDEVVRAIISNDLR